MTKKKILIPFIIFSTVLTTSSVYIYQMLYAPNFLINQPEKIIIIKDEIEFDDLRNQLIEDTLLNDVISFSVLSKLMEYDKNIKVGAYKVDMNMSNYDMISMLRSGNQTPINITFSYARKIDDLAEKITDKLKISGEELKEYLYENLDKYQGFNELDIISIFLPDTYEVYWNISPKNLKSILQQIDFVFHFSANADVRFGIDNPRRDFSQNIDVTLRILEAMKVVNVTNIVFSSTGSVYGDTRVTPTPENSEFPIQNSIKNIIFH